MQANKFKFTVTALTLVVLLWGFWLKFGTSPTAFHTEGYHEIMKKHIEYVPYVVRTHENAIVGLHDDAKSVLIYRYSDRMCGPCYSADLKELRLFMETFRKLKCIVLPAYFDDNRSNRIKMAAETEGFSHINIPPDSLPLPINSNGEDMRYFAVLDKHGQVGMVFFPTRGRQDLTRLYFNEIKRFFTDDETDF